MTSYRPDIDGLRAVAVVLVVLYHAGIAFPGGYVGVDVFFVISGYLITSLILKDVRKDNFSLADFWERRCRRIFPALSVMVGVTLIAGYLLLLPGDLERLGRSAQAQSLMMANMYFWQTTDYFNNMRQYEQPLLHTWSLAVEEQFYLIMPVLFLLPFVKKLGNFTLAAIFGIGIMGSLAIAVWGVANYPFGAFFLLPPRAWELLCGAMLAVLPLAKLSHQWIRETIALCGLAAIFISASLYGKTTPFPGWAALPPCLGAGLVIAAGTSASLVTRILAWSPVVFLGLISYSLYLWHWPIMAFCDYWKIAPFNAAERWLMVLASLLLAVFSWRYIETPFRRKKKGGTGGRHQIFILAGGVSVFLLVCASLTALLAGIPGRVPQGLKPIVSAIGDRSTYPEPGLKEISKGEFIPLGREDASAKVEFFVWGDSHAKAAMVAFDEWGRRENMAGRGVALGATAPLMNVDYGHPAGNRDVVEISREVLAYIEREKIPHVFLVAAWALYEELGGPGKLEQELRNTIAALARTGTQVWVILDVPVHDVDVPRAMVRSHLFFRDKWNTWGLQPGEHRRRNKALYTLSRSDDIPANFLDPAPLFEEKNSPHYAVQRDGVPLYSDNNHLTNRGVMLMLYPMLRKALPGDSTSVAP